MELNGKKYCENCGAELTDNCTGEFCNPDCEDDYVLNIILIPVSNYTNEEK